VTDHGMPEVLVNAADWAPPAKIPDGWIVANASRPLAGHITWQDSFRRGVFYAAAPEVVGGTFGWAADDAGLITLIGNAEIERRVLAKFAEYGYMSAEEAGVTVAEQAGCMRLPWHGVA
jgi:hypothetical protein